ncbi:hypothetical protein QSF18_004148 [Escherichia coli]
MTMGILPYLEESRQQKHQCAVTSVQSPVCGNTNRSSLKPIPR